MIAQLIQRCSCGASFGCWVELSHDPNVYTSWYEQDSLRDWRRYHSAACEAMAREVGQQDKEREEQAATHAQRKLDAAEKRRLSRERRAQP